MTNRCPIGAYRGVGWTPGHVARETFIDDIARELGIDPVELRLQNAIPDEPFTTVTGMKYDGGSYSASIRKVMEMIDYEGLRRQAGRSAQGGPLPRHRLQPLRRADARGAQRSPRPTGSRPSSSTRPASTIEPDGSVTSRPDAQPRPGARDDPRPGRRGHARRAVREHPGRLENDTGRAVYGTGTYASRTAVIAGGAIMRAGPRCASKIVRARGPRDGGQPGGRRARRRRRSASRASPTRSMTMQQVGMLAYYGGAARRRGRGAGADRRRGPTTRRRRTATARSWRSSRSTSATGKVGPAAHRVLRGLRDDAQPDGRRRADGRRRSHTASAGRCTRTSPTTRTGSSWRAASWTTCTRRPPKSRTWTSAHIETPSVVTEGGIKGMGESGQHRRRRRMSQRDRGRDQLLRPRRDHEDADRPERGPRAHP